MLVVLILPVCCCPLLHCESLFVCSFVIHVWHSRFPLNGIKTEVLDLLWLDSLPSTLQRIGSHCKTTDSVTHAHSSATVDLYRKRRTVEWKIQTNMCQCPTWIFRSVSIFEDQPCSVTLSRTCANFGKQPSRQNGAEKQPQETVGVWEDLKYWETWANIIMRAQSQGHRTIGSLKDYWET